MAITDLDKLTVQFGADVSELQRGVSRAESIVEKSSQRIVRSAALSEKALRSVGKGFGNEIQPYRLIQAGRAFDNVSSRVGILRGSLLATTAVVGGLTAAMSSNLLARYADTFTQINNQIRPLTKSSGELETRFQAIADIADRSRSGLRETAILYSRIGKAIPTLSQERLGRIAETIQKGLQLGGATTQEASGAAIQFSQGLASNRLGGDELRSVLESPLGGFLAKGLGVSIGKLRELSIEGKLTASTVIKALENISAEVDTSFTASIRTLDQSITQADNKLIQFIGSADQAYGVTSALGDAILGLANNLNILAPALLGVGATLGTAFAGRLVGRAGGRLTGSVAALREAARLRLQNANEQAGRAGELFSAADTDRQFLRRVPVADRTSRFADPKAISDVEGNARRIIGLEAKIAKAVDGVAIARQKAAEIQAVTGSKAISVSNAILKSEQRLAEKRSDVDRLEKFLKFSPNAVDAQKLRARAGIAALQEENRIVARRAELANLADGAERAAAAKRIEAVHRVIAAENSLVALRAAAGSATSERSQLIRARDVSSATNYAKELAEVEKRTTSLGGAFAATRIAQAEAANAATKTGLALSGIGAAASGLVAFFGGPLGIALTGFTAILGIMAFQSKQAEIRMSEAEKVMRDLGITATDTSTGTDALAKSLQSLGDAKILEDIAKVEAALADLKDNSGIILGPDSSSIEGLIRESRDRSLSSGRGSRASVTGEQKGFAEVNDLLKQFDAGKIKADDLRKRLDEISKTDISKGLRQFILDASRVIAKIGDFQKTIDAATAQLDPSKKKQDLLIDRAEGEKQSMLALEALQKQAGDVQKQLQSEDALTDSQRELKKEIERLTEELTKAGPSEFLSKGEIEKKAQENIDLRGLTSSGNKASDLLKQFEGFRSEPYYDVNAYRAGYGSDTFTTASGDVSSVKAGQSVSKADAERDLARRIKEFQAGIIQSIGKDTFDALGESAQAALTSIAYNYGSLPKNVAAAARTGDRAALAESIRSREDDNGGINKKRRNIEADLVLANDPVAKAASDEADDKKKKLEDLTKEQERRTESIKRETEAIGQNVFEKTKSEAIERLTNAQKDAGVKITAAVTAEINKQATAEAALAQAKAEAEYKKSSDDDYQKRIAAIKAEVDALSQTEGQAAATAYALEELKKAEEAGVPISEELRASILGKAQALGQYTDSLERANLSSQNASELNDTFKSATKGLVQDLIAGKSAAEAFSSALGKIGDKLIDIGLNSLFSATGIFGNSQGQGGLGGLLAGIFGFENGGIMSPSGPLPLRKYANGGVASGPQVAVYGEGRMNEAYVPLPDGRSIPVTMKTPRIPDPSAYSRGNRVSVNPKMDIRFAVDITGARSDKDIELMTRAQIAASIPGIKAQIPDWIQQINEGIVS